MDETVTAPEAAQTEPVQPISEEGAAVTAALAAIADAHPSPVPSAGEAAPAETPIEEIVEEVKATGRDIATAARAKAIGLLTQIRDALPSADGDLFLATLYSDLTHMARQLDLFRAHV